MKILNKLKAKELIKSFLIEDIFTGDLSAELVFSPEAEGSGVFLSKDDGVICGVDIILTTYEAFGDFVEVNLLKKDGEPIKKGENIAEVKGKIRTLLSCERVILNLLQRMSGIATVTKTAVELLNDKTIRICDTRKTTPGLRMFEKYAVRLGGGFNHRMGLYDGVMLKDNHIAFSGGISEAVKLVKSQTGQMVKAEVEAETKEQVLEAVKAGADVIMFDNRTPDEIRELSKLVPKNIITEASGGIGIHNIADFKGCGVDYISMGSLTHSVKPLDISFNSSNGAKANFR